MLPEKEYLSLGAWCECVCVCQQDNWANEEVNSLVYLWRQNLEGHFLDFTKGFGASKFPSVELEPPGSPTYPMAASLTSHCKGEVE